MLVGTGLSPNAGLKPGGESADRAARAGRNRPKPERGIETRRGWRRAILGLLCRNRPKPERGIETAALERRAVPRKARRNRPKPERGIETALVIDAEMMAMMVGTGLSPNAGLKLRKIAPATKLDTRSEPA